MPPVELKLKYYFSSYLSEKGYDATRHIAAHHIVFATQNTKQARKQVTYDQWPNITLST
jgi:hypothetical protein